MNREDVFIWLVYAGLGVQITTSHRAIDAMTIALCVPRNSLPPDQFKLAEMAKELIDWRFNGKRKPRWLKNVLPEGHELLEVK